MWEENKMYVIPLKLALQFETLAALRGVSAVARGETPSSQTQGGFLQAAKRARGHIDRLKKMPVREGSSQTWWQRRNAFCDRHQAQQLRRHEPLLETTGQYQGTPTRRQLGLIMWMGSSLSPAQLRAILPRVRNIIKNIYLK